MFIYDENLEGGRTERFRGKNRIRANPDIVAAHQHQLSALPDLDYYLQWAERKKLAPQIKAATKFDLDIPFKQPPFEHQKRALAFILNTPAQGLFAEPGTGKTYCALVAAETRIKQGKCDKVLVICPASICTTGWYKDLKKFTNLTGVVVNSQPWKWHCPDCGKRIPTYCRAKKHSDHPDEELKWNDHKKPVERLHNIKADVYIASINMVALHLDEFLKAGFNFVILDESTMIKTPSAKQTKAVHTIGWQAKYRLALTGTPITNDLEDIWAQMQFIDASLDSTISTFRAKYYWQHPTLPFVRSPKAGAQEKVSKLIEDSTLTIRKADCLDLPERTSVVHHIEPSREIKKVYNQFCKDFFATHKDEEVIAFNTFTEILRLHQILNGFWTKKETGEVHIIDPNPPKLKAVKEIIEETENKVIIWANYRHDSSLLEAFLREYNPAVCNGQKHEVDKFLEKEDCKVMIAHPKSARFGHTWNVADTTIYYTYGYSVEDYWQSRDRNYRIGQDKSVREVILCSGGIEERILGAISKKEAYAQEFMQNFKVEFNQLRL